MTQPIRFRIVKKGERENETNMIQNIRYRVVKKNVNNVNAYRNSHHHGQFHGQEFKSDTDQEDVSYVRADKGGEGFNSESEENGEAYLQENPQISCLQTLIEMYKSYISILKDYFCLGFQHLDAEN